MVRKNRILTLVLAAAVLAVVTIGSASAATTGWNGEIMSKITGSDKSALSASWETPGNGEQLSANKGDVVKCMNKWHNTATVGTMTIYWGRDLFGLPGVFQEGDSGYWSAGTVAQGQTTPVDEGATIKTNAPAGTYTYETGHIYYTSSPMYVYNPYSMTQKVLTVNS